MHRIAIALAVACAAMPGLAQAVDPHALSALFFEAPQTQAEGARSFSGNIAWTGAVEAGVPELVGKGRIEGRDVAISLAITRNTDPALPAGLVFHIGLPPANPGVAGAPTEFAELRDVMVTSNPLDDLGTKLIGVSARVSGSTFLFATSGAKADAEKNASLLQGAAWLQLDLQEAGGLPGQLLLRFTPAAQTALQQVLTPPPAKP